MSMEFLIQQMTTLREGHLRLTFILMNMHEHVPHSANKQHLRLTFILMNMHEHGVPHSANDNVALKLISEWPLF